MSHTHTRTYILTSILYCIQKPKKKKQTIVGQPSNKRGKKKKNSIINLCNCALLWYRVHDLSIYSYSFFLTFCTLLFVLVYLSISFKKIFCRSFFACEILNPSILRVRERERDGLCSCTRIRADTCTASQIANANGFTHN